MKQSKIMYIHVFMHIIRFKTNVYVFLYSHYMGTRCETHCYIYYSIFGYRYLSIDNLHIELLQICTKRIIHIQADLRFQKCSCRIVRNCILLTLFGILQKMLQYEMKRFGV